jgi:DnaK suppressor protein
MKKLTSLQIKSLKNKLQEEKMKFLILKKVTSENFILDEKKGDEVDNANEEYYRTEVLRFRNRDALYLKKIEKALLKIQQDEYGFCYYCSESIKYERLLARPTADCCIRCKEKLEFEEKQNIYDRKTKSLSSNVNFHDYV